MKPRALHLFICGLALALPFLTGCVGGYQVGDVKPSEYANVNTIWVPTFKNETLEPRIAAIATNASISAIQQDGTFKVGNEDNSDVALRARITRIRRNQQRSANNQVLQTQEMLVQVRISWYLEDLVTGQRIKSSNPFGVDESGTDLLTGQRRDAGDVTGQTSIFLDPNFQLSDRQALALAVEDAAEQLVSRLSEGW
ncbi:MAG: hypothetical protein ACI8UO_001748 [Verrucomicrobiales bacterium]|jgi:hypothetical protein